MRTVIVIPARYQSSRFPGKPLVKLLGKPMILWVAELCEKALPKEDIYIATEDKRIADIVQHAGFNVVMTSAEALTGTDRLSEVAVKVNADIYLNVQGDEPLLDPNDILKVMDFKKKHPSEVVNGYCPLGPDEDPNNINIPKVIFTEDKRLVYMSRQALPGYKSKECAPVEYYKQVCIYAFSRDDLMKYREFERKSVLESSEDIEILRFLEWGTVVRMVETQPGSLAIDVESDVKPVEEALSRTSLNRVL
jgi:3-deoxy-manno-octulosonate cytidylyltransferase (CMP-KDO synthetase)